MKIVVLRRRILAAVVCVAAAVGMLRLVSHPRVVGAAASTRQLPIYCVETDYKVVSLSFDAAWGDVRVRQFPLNGKLPHSFYALYFTPFKVY